MRQPNPEELGKLKARHEVLLEAAKAAREAEALYTRLVGAVAEACDLPPNVMLDDRQEPWHFALIVGQAEGGQPVLGPIEETNHDQ
jgi:hypothetical protein